MKKLLRKRIRKVNMNVVLYANEGGTNEKCWGGC